MSVLINNVSLKPSFRNYMKPNNHFNFLKKNGALIRSALETRFPSKSILTLQEYQSRQKNNPSETSFLSGLFSFFVYNGDKRNEADQFDHSVGEQRSRKRRRTD